MQNDLKYSQPLTTGIVLLVIRLIYTIYSIALGEITFTYL